MIPRSFQIVAKMVKNRGLEGVWGCFVACLRPKAPVGRFLDGSGAALGRLLAHLGRLLGGSWAVLGARLGRSRASWRQPGGILEETGRENGAKLASKLNRLKILCLISAKPQNHYFPLDSDFSLTPGRPCWEEKSIFECLGGLLERPLGPSWRYLKAT